MTARPIHHIGYIVPDIPRAVAWAAATLGAGPFHLIEHLPFDEVTFEGEPARYDHSSAFGQWGAIRLELTQVHAADPPGLRAALGARPAPAIGHVAWLADDLDAESERLVTAGLRPFHTGRAGPVRAIWFDGSARFGHPIEVLARAPELMAFYGLLAEAAAGWDGRDPLRPAPGAPGSR